VSVDLLVRDDFLEQIDQFGGEELSFPGRSAAIALLVSMGLQQWERQQEKPRN